MSLQKFALKKIQQDVVEAHSKDAIDHIESASTDERRVGIRVVTGGGKTLIVCYSTRKIFQHFSGKVAMIWLTPSKGELVDQTYCKLSDHLDQSGIEVLRIEDTPSKSTLENCVMVVGWDALNRKEKDGSPANIYMREGERNNFPDLCSATREAGIPILLVIDESHAYAFTEKSLEIRNQHIKPVHTTEISATPKNTDWDASYKLKYKQVADAGLIKNRIELGGFLSISDGLRKGCDKLKEMLKVAANTTQSYNPRGIIFLPNGDAELEQALSYIKQNYQWSEETGEVVVWMSKRKSHDYERCKDNKSNVKVIITKEALDTGIDIPAVQVEVHLRPNGSRILRMQRLGRGLRMPEQRHYGNELDTLYVFVFNDAEYDYEDAEDLKDVIGTSLVSSSLLPEFEEEIENFPRLPLAYYTRKKLLRESDGSLFSEHFSPLFERRLNDHNGLDLSNTPYQEKVRQETIEAAHLDEQKIRSHNPILDGLSEDQAYLFLLRRMRTDLKHLFKYWKDDSGVSISDSIADFLGNKVEDFSAKRMDLFVLKNYAEILRLIFEAEKEAQDNLDETKELKTGVYCLPKTCTANGEFDGRKYPRFLHDKQILRRGGQNTNEQIIESRWSVSSESVRWWFRNYDQQYGQSFSVVYVDSMGRNLAFFPDYIVCLVDGTILIVDVKSGNGDVNEAKKRDALVAAVKEFSNVRAGILKPEGKYWYLHGADDKVESLDEILQKASR